MTQEETNRLIQEHRYLARKLARRVYHRLRFRDYSVTADDLEAWGLLGLWKAVKTFDPARGDFLAYATRMVYFAICTGLREANEMTRCHLRDIAAGTAPPVRREPLLDGPQHDRRAEPPWAGLQRADARRLLAGYFGRANADLLDRLLAGQSQRAIAVPLGITATAVANRLRALKARLRQSSLKDRLEEFTGA